MELMCLLPQTVFDRNCILLVNFCRIIFEGHSCKMSETKLNSIPDDGISAVTFAPNSSQFLLVSSWDCTVRLYDINENFMRMKYTHSSPVLDCCFQVCIAYALARQILATGHHKQCQVTKPVG